MLTTSLTFPLPNSTLRERFVQISVPGTSYASFSPICDSLARSMLVSLLFTTGLFKLQKLRNALLPSGTLSGVGVTSMDCLLSSPSLVKANTMRYPKDTSTSLSSGWPMEPSSLMSPCPTSHHRNPLSWSVGRKIGRSGP